MELQKKLNKAQADIKAGRVYTQDEVESYFKAKFERSKKAPSKIKKR